MAERHKRQRLSEDGNPALISGSIDEDLPSKRRRKETNASARRSLFVRSLPPSATTEDLTELFSQNYPLKHTTVVLDPKTKESKGYGFVTFADGEDAERAKDEFHGYSLQGRKLRVEIAEPRLRDASKKDSVSAEIIATKKARQEKLAEARQVPKLIIRNLPWSIKDPEQLAVLFRKFGKVKHATLPKVRNKQAGFGFIVMRGRKNAERALAEVNGNVVDGRPLAVDWAVEKDVWEQQKQNDEDMHDDADEQDDGDQDIENGEDEAAKDKSDDDLDDDMKSFMKNHFENLEDEDELDNEQDPEDDEDELDDEEDDFDEMDVDISEDDLDEPEDPKTKNFITDNSSTLFIRNLPFTTLDADLKEHFTRFGPVRYARVVMDKATDRPKGTGFVCFFNVEDAEKCFRDAPLHQPTGANAVKKTETNTSMVKHSVLQDEEADATGMYTIEGRLLQISRAVDKDQAAKLTEASTNTRDKDKRRTYLLSEGTISQGTPLYDALAPSEVKMREDSASQRRKLIQNNPSLHLSLTRLSIRNIPRNVTSKDLKALAREAVVGFAKDVKEGRRTQLSKEEEARGGDVMRALEKERKLKGKGVVRQAKIVFEGREGSKIPEASGAGRSRGYGFVEYSSHRWALMGLRWLNGHAVQNSSGKKQRMIVEFAIENAQVVERRREREAKARQRSKEVTEAMEKGEITKEKKKTFTKDQLMAKTRKGSKAGGSKGKKGKKGEQSEKQQGVKRKRGPEKDDAKNSAEAAKLAQRQRIIGKKRAARRQGKKGKA